MKIEKIDLNEIVTCDYGDTDRIIDYLLVLGVAINRIISAHNERGSEENAVLEAWREGRVTINDNRADTLEDVLYSYMNIHGYNFVNSEFRKMLATAIREYFKGKTEKMKKTNLAILDGSRGYRDGYNKALTDLMESI